MRNKLIHILSFPQLKLNRIFHCYWNGTNNVDEEPLNCEILTDSEVGQLMGGN